MAPLPPPPGPATSPPSAPASATLPPPKPAAMGPAPATFAPVSPAPVPPIRASAATSAPNPGDIVAQAQQAPPRSLDSSGRWTGFYLGGNVGYGTTRGGGNETCLNAVTNSSSGCDIINSPALSTSGVFGGGQLGYTMPLSGLNLPLGPNPPPLMIGIEADIQPTGISGTQNVSGPFNFVGFPGFSCSPCSFKASQQIDWFSSVRGRIGVPVDDFLFYGTGGIMFGSIRASQSLNFLGSPQGNIGTVKRGADGPVFGGGVEVLLPGPFSAKFEGLYYDLGDLKTVGLPVNGAPTNFTDFKTFGFHGAIFRAGINMKLGGLGGT